MNVLKGDHVRWFPGKSGIVEKVDDKKRLILVRGFGFKKWVEIDDINCINGSAVVRDEKEK